MAPAKPPLPCPWYLPFQPEAGSHTSILMSESLDGLTSATTRQKAGTSLNIGIPDSAPAGTNAPAATVLAEMIVVSASFRTVNLSQVAAKAGAAVKTSVARKTPRTRTRDDFIFSSQCG